MGLVNIRQQPHSLGHGIEARLAGSYITATGHENFLKKIRCLN